MTYHSALLLAGFACLACDGAATSAPATDAATSDTTEPLILGELSVAPHPTNVLACYVSWRSSRPATSIIRFGEASQLTHQIAVAGLRTAHRVFVYGLRAETRYTLQASSRAADGVMAVATTLRFDSGELPTSVQAGIIRTMDPHGMQPGWQLMVVGPPPLLQQQATAVLYDSQGQPRWYHSPDAREGIPNGDVQWLGEGKLLLSMGGGILGLGGQLTTSALIIDLEGQVLWRGPPNPASQHGSAHHQFSRLENGNFIALRYQVKDNVLGDLLVELDEKGAIVWSWDVFDHLTPPVCSGANPCDWTHGNHVAFDDALRFAYFNARNTSTVYKIDKTSGDLIWKLGADGDFTFVGSHTHPWFEEAHAVKLLGPGRILLYDNGTIARGFSRAVEYRLDEQAMTAQLVWEFASGGTERWFTGYWGDADRLANGNTLITAGTWNLGGQTQLLEVTSEGRVVWKMLLPVVNGLPLGAYNSERIAVPFEAL